MTLDTTRTEIESLVDTVEISATEIIGEALLCSGALGLPGAPPPVLCATEALAIELWRRTARDYIGEHESLGKLRLIWTAEPRVIKFKMTIQDTTGGQRVAATRYVVYSQCAIEGVAPDAVPAESVKRRPGRPKGSRNKPRRKARGPARGGRECLKPPTEMTPPPAATDTPSPTVPKVERVTEPTSEPSPSNSSAGPKPKTSPEKSTPAS